MVDVGDFKWPIAVPWRFQVQVPIEGFHLIACTPALPLQCLIESRSLPHRKAESLIARSGCLLGFTGKLQLYPGRILRFLFQRLVISLDAFPHKATRRFWQLRCAISSGDALWQRAQEAAPMGRVGLPIAIKPAEEG